MLIGLLAILPVPAKEMEHHNAFLVDPLLSAWTVLSFDRIEVLGMGAGLERHFPGTMFALRVPLVFARRVTPGDIGLLYGSGLGGKVFLDSSYRGYMVDINFSAAVFEFFPKDPDLSEDTDLIESGSGRSWTTLWRFEWGHVWRFENFLLQLSGGAGLVSAKRLPNRPVETVAIPTLSLLFGFPFSLESITRIKSDVP